jgi:hypothetical protein
MRHFQQRKEINDYFSNFEKNTKAYLKRFFDEAFCIVVNLLPSEMVDNLRSTLTNLSKIIEGDDFDPSELVCLRDIQVTNQKNER